MPFEDEPRMDCEFILTPTASDEGTRVASRTPAHSRGKRAFDLWVSVGLLVFITPLLLAIAACVKASSPGPALFRQRRTGLDGQTFTIFKFRTMRVAEETTVIEQARRADPRVTWMGRFLRRASLDELPQLLNVIHGDMSLVGPRPHAMSHDDLFAKSVPNYNQRFRTRPGITGLAQAAGFRGEILSQASLSERIRLDNEYIDQWSLGLDLQILAKTVRSVAFHKSAY